MPIFEVKSLEMKSKVNLERVKAKLIPFEKIRQHNCSSINSRFDAF